MAEIAKLVAQRRTKTGKTWTRRLRKQGIVPGTVYGHRQEPVSIEVPAETLRSIVHSGSKVVDLEIDGTSEKVMFRDLEWDPFGQRIQHFDLLRVDPDERIAVEVPIELRGVAPGTLAGGVLEQTLRTLKLECLAFKIPDSIKVRIGELEIGKAIHVGDIEVPEGVTIQTPPELTIVHVVMPVVIEEVAPAAAEVAPAEPELIGRKAEEPEED